AVDICKAIDNVVYPASTPEDLQETVSLVEQQGRRIVPAQMDVRDYDTLKDTVDAAVERLGRLDIIVANAGIGNAGNKLHKIPEHMWDDMIDINLTGVWHSVKAGVPHLLAGGRGGLIILTGSVGGMRAHPHTGHYIAAKHGVVGLMRTFAVELGQHMIRVNSIHPTQVNTQMVTHDAAFGRFAPHEENPGPEAFAPVSQMMHTLPVPWVEPEDISNAVLFFASDESRYVTGGQLPVDAGWLLKEDEIEETSMPDYDFEEMTKEAEQYIKFEKDVKNRIAYITFDRPEAQNSTTLGMRQNYADLIHKCNVDDDVKVVVIRGEGEDFGSGGDLPEQRGMLENPGMPLLHELAINDDEVKYPPGGSYRYLSTVTDFYAKARAGNRPLQELRKISIIEAKGYCYGWHFYQAGDADLVVSSDDALFGHPAFRYVGWGPRLWWWAETMGLRKFSEMLFTGRPFTAEEMDDCGFLNSVVPRDALEAETQKYALACSKSRPTDTVAVQKTFLELYKQHKGEYFGSLLTGMVEGMLLLIQNDQVNEVDLTEGTFAKGLNNVVKDNDLNFPPEWRLSRSGRSKP